MSTIGNRCTFWHDEMISDYFTMVTIAQSITGAFSQIYALI